MEPSEHLSSSWAPPGVNVPLVTLSPPFVSADDAARFAHELIGDHRDVQYGGVILKNELDQYFATRPVTGHTALFRPERVLSTDATGRFTHPPGFTCVAFYHSHADTYEQIQTLYEGWPSESLFTRVNFFSPSDIYDMLRMGSFAPASYLSGLNGSLIKYACSGSDSEKKMAVLLGQARDRSDKAIDSLVKAVLILIKLGTLSVIQSNELWGQKVGVMDESFQPYVPRDFLDIERVIILRPAFGPVMASEALALDYLRARVDQTPGQLHGVILKHTQRDEFVVSEPVTGSMDFPLAPIFEASREGVPQVPAGFAIVALYGCDAEYRDPTLIPAEQASLFRNLMHPGFLEQGLAVARQLGRPMEHRALPLYIATRDGAMLKYVSRYADAERRLFARLPEGEGGGMELIRNVLAGVEQTLSVVHSLAHAGELSVVHTSDLWSRVGRVQTHWQPFAGFMRRPLGPSFVSADDAARHAHEQIAGRVDAVYGGLIYQGADQLFFATEPLPVHTETFNARQVMPPEKQTLAPPGATVVGVYQTHRVYPTQLWRPELEEQLSRNLFDPHELYAAIKERDWAKVCYLSTAQGALLKYTPSGSDIETKFLARLAPPTEHPEQVRNNWMQSRLRANSLKPSDYVAQICRAGDLHVVVGSALWGNPGQVTTKWKPGEVRPGIYETKELPPLSPVFSQAQDAMGYVHERMGARKSRQFGVILKKVDADEYVATCPVSANGLGMQLGRIFPRVFGAPSYSLPGGYQYHGVYVATPDQPGDPVPGALYGDFIAPRDLAHSAVLMSTVRDFGPWGAPYPPLFISTRDGALLSCRVLTLSRLLELEGPYSSQSSMLKGLLGGQVSALQYVRDVAASGELEVVRTSTTWAAAGRVSTAWKPYVPNLGSAPQPHRLALGPEFAHIDDAVLYCHRRMPHPHGDDVVGAVLRRTASGRFVAVEPFTNGVAVAAQDQVFIDPLFEWATGRSAPQPVLPAGSTPWAICYAHRPVTPVLVKRGQRGWVDNIFRPMDICYAVKSLGRLGFTVNIAYVSGNDGALLKYVRRPGMGENDLCDTLIDTDYSVIRLLNQQWADSGSDTESAYVNKLLGAGELVVVSPSSHWPRVGWVTAGWKDDKPAPVGFEVPWARSTAALDKDEL